jgi:FkbM family methyltransferase
MTDPLARARTLARRLRQVPRRLALGWQAATARPLSPDVPTAPAPDVPSAPGASAPHPLIDETPDPALLRRRGGFSSHGEDAAVQALLLQRGPLRAEGFYVDVGAFHPFVFSNTAVLSLMGWRGVNVEPNPHMADRLRRARPRDVTLQVAVGAAPGRAELQMFSEWGSSNTLDTSFADMISTSQQVAVTERVEVDVLTLADVLDGRVPADGVIDFLSVDVEGLDLAVLQSGDWARFRPLVVAVEDLDLDLTDVAASPLHAFMRSVGYRMRAHVVLTSLYTPEDAPGG